MEMKPWSCYMYQQFQICRKQMRSQQIDDHIDKQYNQVSNLCQVVCKITPFHVTLFLKSKDPNATRTDDKDRLNNKLFTFSSLSKCMNSLSHLL